MKRCSFKLSVAILTFVIGVALTWIYPNFYLNRKYEEWMEVKQSPKEDSVTVNVNYYSKLNDLDFAVVAVTNRSSETLYYKGWEIDEHCDYKLDVGDKIIDRYCSCGTTEGLQALEPERSVFFKIPLIDENKKSLIKDAPIGLEFLTFRIGLPFLIGENRVQKVFWSSKYTISTKEVDSYNPEYKRPWVDGLLQVRFFKISGEKDKSGNKLLEFEVYNGTKEKISYFSQGRNWADTYYRKTGHKITQVWVGLSDTKHNLLEPGRAAIIRVSASEWEKSKNNQIGFPFQFEKGNLTKTIWSEEFFLSDFQIID